MKTHSGKTKKNRAVPVVPTRTCTDRMPERATRKLTGIVLTVAMLAVCATVIFGSAYGRRNSDNMRQGPSTFGDLFAMDKNELAGTDIALVNLLCAQGLEGSEGLDVDAAVAILDEWAEQIRNNTEKNIFRYHANPVLWKNSINWWRCAAMVSYLNSVLKTSYNPQLKNAGLQSYKDTKFYRNSQDIFIHGLLTGNRQGSCTSIPVMVVSIGRRLGYPLKLVRARGHLFARWDAGDGRERFNIEATDRLAESRPDEFYLSWPTVISLAELKNGLYLKSMTPIEELATFISFRGLCLCVSMGARTFSGSRAGVRLWSRTDTR